MTRPIPASFVSGLDQLGIELTADQRTQLGELVALLLAANQRTNLTAIRDWDVAWQRHVLDSLSLVPWLPAGTRVVDVGAGGGLPGLVLAIARPDLRVTLVDAIGKKVQHMVHCAQALALSNVEAVHGRAEVLAGRRGGHRERYHVGVARALAPLPVLLELVTPFIVPGGSLLAIKGQRVADELAIAGRALEALHCRVDRQVPTLTGIIVKIDKTAPTPERYPRRAGEPKRRPLG